MKAAYIAAGAARMYCGSCLRDNALAAAVRALGHDMTLVPAYTPLRVDEEPASEGRVFFGAVDVYLQEKFARMRTRPGLLGQLLGGQGLLRLLSRFALSASPASLGKLTVSMLRGEEGNQRRSLLELVGWLGAEVQPHIVHLTNSLFAGFAREIKRALKVPVVASLQGEDLFLERLPEPYRRQALELLAERGRDIDCFTATSVYHADHMAAWVGLDRSKIEAILPGIRLEAYASPPPARPPERPLTIGYLARIAPEKGFHLLARAFCRLAGSGRFPGLRLKAAGFLGGQDYRYAASVRRALAARGITSQVEILGTVDRAGKMAFLREIDVLSVPTIHAEPKGLFVLEALASGVPVVEPRHGSFPELLAATGGGLLFEPGNEVELAEKLATLLADPVLRQRLGEAGREAVFDRFSSRRMAAETVAVYERLLA